MNDTNHPVTRALRHAAAGGTLRDVDLDDLKLPAEHRRKLAEAARAIDLDRAGGEFGSARNRARAAADDILAGLPPEQQDPDYLDVLGDADQDLNPAALAARVPRW